MLAMSYLKHSASWFLPCLTMLRAFFSTSSIIGMSGTLSGVRANLGPSERRSTASGGRGTSSGWSWRTGFLVAG